jgi:hypothetical protein
MLEPVSLAMLKAIEIALLNAKLEAVSIAALYAMLEAVCARTSLCLSISKQQAKYSMLNYLRAETQKQVHFCTKNWLPKVCSPPVGWHSLG